MNINRLYIAIAVLLLPSAGYLYAEKNLLQIYLPRNVAINGDVAVLRDIAVLKGEETQVSKANEITLGRISHPGAEISIDRKTLLSRLASNGIYASDVIITGAQTVVIGRKGYLIKPSDFISAAQEEIAKSSKDSSICGWKCAWLPKEYVVDGSGSDIKLTARLITGNTQTQLRAAVAVVQNEKEVCVREIAFNPQYKNTRTVAAIDIQPDTIINSDNVHIETYESAIMQQGYVQPYGLSAKRQIKAGTVISAEMLESTRSPVLVSRNQGVVIQIKQPGLFITAMGQALEDGRAKQCVKVRNIDSQRVLLARVNEDGTVEPVY